MNRFYLIVDDIKWIYALIPSGVQLVQLRVKDKSGDEVQQQVVAAKNFCLRYNCQLIVNDYWQIAIDTGCDYLHLGQADLDTADMKAIRKAGLRVGISTHDHAELERALSLDPDYVALGPIYPTILKQMPWKPQGLDKIKEWKNIIGDKPLVAIGGLNIARLKGVFEAGADSAAVVTDITLNPHPKTRTKQWIDATKDECDGS